MIEVEQSEVGLPLVLTVEKLGSGGLTGLVPTVALRDGSTLGRYLDWADNVFKTSGWTVKYAPMSEVESGHYQLTLNVSSLSLPLGFRMIAEYHVESPEAVGDASDLFLVTNKRATLELLRKIAKNRQEEVSGNPGKLRVYDDDDASVLVEYDLRDELGGAVTSVRGTPARRSKGTP